MRSRDAVVTLHGQPPTHLTLSELEAIGIRHAFTTRHHGSFDAVSAPAGPFPLGAAPALEALGVTRARVRFARQVHGTTCLSADDAGPGLVGTGDALITTVVGRPLAIFTADCLAVVLVDPGLPLLAVAHAGWRGTVGGILGRLVEVVVTRFRARPERLRAAIGPSIGPCCYEVDEPVIKPLQTAFPASASRWARPVAAKTPGRWWLDLWRANTEQLVTAGVRPEAILAPRLCTGCRRDLFFSYRKEGPGLRLATLALLT